MIEVLVAILLGAVILSIPMGRVIVKWGIVVVFIGGLVIWAWANADNNERQTRAAAEATAQHNADASAVLAERARPHPPQVSVVKQVRCTDHDQDIKYVLTTETDWTQDQVGDWQPQTHYKDLSRIEVKFEGTEENVLWKTTNFTVVDQNTVKMLLTNGQTMVLKFNGNYNTSAGPFVSYFDTSGAFQHTYTEVEYKPLMACSD